VGGEVDVRPAVQEQRAHDVRDRPGGKVIEVLRKVGPARHDELVLAALGAAAG
jgi:hypothetical protein